MTRRVGYRLVKTYQADDYFGTSKRPSAPRKFLKARVSEHDNRILATAHRLGLEPALLKAIVHIESAFNPAALSQKGQVD